MKRNFKKMLSLVIMFGSVFAFVFVVNGASATLLKDETVRVTKTKLGSSFTTRIYASSKSGTPTVETQIGRKMFNLVWYDSGKYNTTITSSGQYYYAYGSANGTYDTRATWTNITNNSSVSGTFDLY